MRLARGPVEGHDPVVRVLLVLRSEQDAVALADRVEEVLAALEVWGRRGWKKKQVLEGTRTARDGVAWVMFNFDPSFWFQERGAAKRGSIFLFFFLAL